MNARPLLLLALALTSARAELPTEPADRFVDSIGVCGHFAYPDTPYGFAFDKVKQKLVRSGIRHLRDGFTARTVELGQAGVQETVVALEDKPVTATVEAIKKANAAGARIVAVEGPNEPDLFWMRYKRSYGGHSYEEGEAGAIAAAAAFQKDLYTALKADPATRGLTVIGPSLGKTYGYDRKSPYGAGALTEAVDWGNFHPYPGGNPFNPPFPYAGVEKYTWQGGHPSTGLDEHPYAFDVYAPPFAPKPMAATETGYSTFSDGPGELAHARYLPRLFAEYFRKGVQRTYSYEFLDEHNKPEDREANFGLLRHDLSEKPAYEALRRLIRLVEDPHAPADFVPKPFPAALTVKPVKGFERTQYVHHVALQRGDGTYLLLLWHEIALDDTSHKPWQRVPLAPPMPTTLQLTRAARKVEVFVPNDSEEPTQTAADTDRVEIGVLDRLMVVRVRF